MSSQQAVVIDNGSGTMKAGLSGQDAPRIKYATVVGKPKMPSIMVGMDQKEAYIGNEAQQKKGVLKLKNPIKNGVISDWEDMIKIWHHTFYNQLRITPEDHPCLLT